MASEILHEALWALGRAWPWLVGATASASTLLGLERWGRGRAGLGRLLLAAGVSLGLFLAWRILWIADDAFISFRYARNFARGLGLVYNEGEWVEGYTNFLWTFLLGLVGKLGVDIPLTALFANLACYVGALLLTARVVARLSPQRPAVPFAALGLALTKPFYTFAGSGLETMPIALLGIAAMALCLRKRGEFWAGVALTAAVLCRPDQLLLYVAMGAALVGEDLVFGEGRVFRRLRLRRYLALAAPFVVLYLPYFMLRWSMYGAPFPNTFYAKSGSSAYWSQGFVYLTHFMSTTGAWLWLPLFLVSIFIPSRRREVFRLRAFAGLSVALLGAYVVRVGGDFMEFRFFVPLLPLVAACTEVGLRQRPAVPARRWALGVVAAFALGFAWTPVRIIRPFEIRWHLAAEETFYQVGSLFPLRIENGHFDAGLALHETLTRRGIRPMVAGGAIGMFGYFSDLPLFDVMGLTSRVVGNKDIRARGRPGHEKRATTEEILEAGVLIDLAPLHGVRWQAQTQVWVENKRFHLVRFEPSLVGALSGIPGARLPDPKRDIRELLQTSTRSELLEAERFYAVFLEPWEGREEALGLLRTRLGSVADFEEEGSYASPFRVLLHRPREGATGRGYLSSRWLEGRGEVHIPLRIAGGELRLALGGTASERLGVELVVQGEVRGRAHPEGAAGLRPVAFDTADLVGREGELRIFDLDPRPEVGLEVDAIHFAHAEGDFPARLAAGDPLGPLLWEAEGSLPAGHPFRTELEARVAERHRFDDGLPPESTIEGEAFGEGPASGTRRRQLPIFGQRGPGLLNSFALGDEGIGRVHLPWRELDGGPIHLLVGGGPDCNRVYVGLEVGGRVVERACGAGDEVLRPARLSTARFKGSRGRVVVVDDSREPWGHILVDELLFERPLL